MSDKMFQRIARLTVLQEFNRTVERMSLQERKMLELEYERLIGMECDQGAATQTREQFISTCAGPAGRLLVESLHSAQKLLSRRPLAAQELRAELSKSVAVAAALTSIYIVHHGRDESIVLELYLRALQQHLQTLSEPDSKLDAQDLENVGEDLGAFASIVSKLGTANLAALPTQGGWFAKEKDLKDFFSCQIHSQIFSCWASGSARRSASEGGSS